jgi:ribosomal protein S21
MAPKDVLEISLTIIASLGGGGAIVFALSGYLGRVWADRTLARQQQEYAQLNITFKNQLDVATRRLQIELDAIGHLHKIRTQAEFEKMQELWKRIAAYRSTDLQC